MFCKRFCYLLAVCQIACLSFFTQVCFASSGFEWLSSCEKPSGSDFHKAVIHYNTYLGDSRSAELYVPENMVHLTEVAFDEAMHSGFTMSRILNFEEFPAGIGIKDALSSNVSTSAVCTLLDGVKHFVLFINPVNNPMLSLQLPCKDESSFCDVAVFPEGGLLSLNRNGAYAGKLDNYVGIFERHGFIYYHMPSKNFIVWSMLVPDVKGGY